MNGFTTDQYTRGLKCYLVGGAVRDSLLGQSSEDKDWVVVGSSPEEMLHLGFLPVGDAFPIFLHPITKEEYALARSEKKSGHGYQGFTFYTDPSVTLEEDLLRRDLTINALALDSQGRLIDPYGGEKDIKAQVFRHVSDAFVEDPLRILRLARFHAQFTKFEMAEETLSLGRNICQSGELAYLAKERILTELMKGFAKQMPSRMFGALHQLTALSVLFPRLELNVLMTLPFDYPLSAEARYALWSLAFQEPKQDLHQYLKASRELMGLADGLYKFMEGKGSTQCSAEFYIKLIEQLGVLKSTQKYEQILAIANCLIDNMDISFWQTLPKILASVDSAAISQQYDPRAGAAIKEAIFSAREEKLNTFLNSRH